MSRRPPPSPRSPSQRASPNEPPLRRGTRLVHSGRSDMESPRPVNVPVVRTSTVLFSSTAQMAAVHAARAEGQRTFSYGRRGTQTAHALEDALTELEGGARTALFPSGLAAIANVFQAYLRPGDHVLIADSVYGPVRRVVSGFVTPFGIQHDYFSPGTENLTDMIRPNTRLIYGEAPGSLTYEMMDLPRIASIARAHDIRIAMDNTWGSGWLYNPLRLGADISILAATKYIVGHSDSMMGAVVTTADAWQPLADTISVTGQLASPDDAYLALRGLRTLGVRLAAHQRHATELSAWLQARPEIRQVIYPALPSHPGHALWQRDFHGACGLLTIELQPSLANFVADFIDALRLFGLGASWGGYESLVYPINLSSVRSVDDWSGRGPLIRLHVGLEDPEDLIDDLHQAFEMLASLQS